MFKSSISEYKIIENGLVLDDIYEQEIDLETYSPGDEGFMIVIEISIGLENQLGKDDFSFTLVDRIGFNKYILNQDPSFNNNGITSIASYNLHVIDNYSFSKLIIGLRKILKSIDVDKDNWTYTAAQLNKYFYWEYERETLSKLKYNR
jgi:Immunity protein 8